MPSPQEVFDSAVAQAVQRNQQAEAAARANANKVVDNSNKTINDIAATLPKMAEGLSTLTQRLSALEQSRSDASQSRSNSNAEDDPYAGLEHLGVTRSHIQPVIQRELGSMLEQRVELEMEKRFGPSLREGAAIQAYQQEHPEFDLMATNRYIAANPDVQKVVNLAREKGAYEAGIEYAALRQSVDAAVTKEAKGQLRREKRDTFVQETRPHAELLGGGGSNLPERSGAAGQNAITLDQLDRIMQSANAGDYKAFEQVFVKSRLPSEEEFQRIAQS